jgi:hypothetical protein
MSTRRAAPLRRTLFLLVPAGACGSLLPAGAGAVVGGEQVAG